VDTEPINTGTMVLPQSSTMFPGDPGLTASAGQSTMDDPLAGIGKPELKLTV
jgi:hypothetical protein